MRNGITGQPIPAHLNLVFAYEIETGCTVPPTFSPILAYAIKVCETDQTDPADVIEKGADLTTMLMPNGSPAGRGLFQLSSSWPANWKDPMMSTMYAIAHFLYPAEMFWSSSYGMQGDNLVRCIAAEYNAGRSGALSGHARGDVGTFTTRQDGKNYSDECLSYYHNLEKGLAP